MKISIASVFLGLAALFAESSAFAPSQAHQPRAAAVSSSSSSSSALYMAKYKDMDEILALFPEDKPVLVNFYDANTEGDIKDDIFRAKQLLADRATLVSIKQQDYPELANVWDCRNKSPSMILFKDGKPVKRLYEKTFYLDIVAHFGKYCEAEA